MSFGRYFSVRLKLNEPEKYAVIHGMYITRHTIKRGLKYEIPSSSPTSGRNPAKGS